MVLPTIPSDRTTGDEGLIEHLRSLGAAIAAYAGARIHLFGIEGKEAGAHYLKIAIWLAAGLFGLVFGYIFSCIACVFLISAFLKVSWMWILLAAGIGHFIVAGVAAAIARSKFGQGMFAATISEFKKDQSWLSTRAKSTKQN